MARRTLQDIAKETGFAVTTVSAVLNERPDCYASAETRRKIHAAVERLGYRPNFFAHALRAHRSRIIGVIGTFYASELQSWQCAGLQRELGKKGYLVVLIDINAGVSKAFNEFDMLNVDGVVAFYDHDARKAIEKVPPHLPVVAVASRPIIGVSTIVVDRKAGIETATKHLIGLGHRKIIFATHGLLQSRLKHAGYVAAMTRAGLESEIRVVDSPKMALGSQLLVTENLEVFRHATAVVTTGDHLALEVICGLHRYGLDVPKRISVMGFGDDSSAVFTPPLITTVHMPRHELGATAARMLLNLIDGGKVRNPRFVPELVKRESDAPPPRSVRFTTRAAKRPHRQTAKRR
jgi:LacI family transcriptional regulator